MLQAAIVGRPRVLAGLRNGFGERALQTSVPVILVRADEPCLEQHHRDL